MGTGMKSWTLLATCLAAALLLAGCNHAQDNDDDADDGDGEDTESTQATVEIREFAFTPEAVAIHEGDTVVWVNMDSVPHTATSSEDYWDTGSFGQGESRSQQFLEADEYHYFCEIHPEMTGTIVVMASESE